jgi:hypothetical protein
MGLRSVGRQVIVHEEAAYWCRALYDAETTV